MFSPEEVSKCFAKVPQESASAYAQNGMRGPIALLTTDSQERKDTPIYSGVIRYFPRALAAIATLSKAGNDKHNPGQPLHWSRGKSNDHKDCIARHLIESGTVDPDDGFLHDIKLGWRALANLEEALEKLALEEAQKDIATFAR
jgi:hypothetical protein